ncbi:hypothetical protein ACPA9J_16715 [Pseudomonas aeruginosa]
MIPLDRGLLGQKAGVDFGVGTNPEFLRGAPRSRTTTSADDRDKRTG